MILASPDILKNMTAEQQAMILASIMFPQQWLRENPEIEHCNVGSTCQIGNTGNHSEIRISSRYMEGIL